jgi:hypothetical protein
MHEEVVKKQLEKLVDEINFSNGNYKLKVNQQVVKTENISIYGANGRLYVKPAISMDSYDISLSGKSLQNQMYSFMCDLVGRECDGYKQINARLGKKDSPFWRTSDFEKVRLAAYYYARTTK